MIAVVGHVEWVEFAVVERVPAPGEIAFASETWSAPGGGGAVPAVELARLAGPGEAVFFTSVGDDALGERTAQELRALGVDVRAARADVPQRRAFTHLDAAAERTITVTGERHVPRGADPLPWDTLADADAVLFTGGDAAAWRRVREARVVVAGVRALDGLDGAEADVVVASAADPDEVRMAAGRTGVVWTEGPAGGRYDGGRWTAAPLDGPPVDAYGCGDTFAAGLTFGLARGLPLGEALALGARCGAACLTRRGPYGR